MSDLQHERNDLIAADRHLVQGEQRITEQLALIQKLTEQGRDTALAGELLRLLEETMAIWQDHRRLILDAIARHERALAPPPQRACREALKNYRRETMGRL
ncbi:hypothetical protein [Microvirga rosea]|uniref:hypothetical protein n=1 Tax=Microvirga rosea TaxID=2715425 RepID=UPI001D09F945|nr:hypothetical protein [Microvirga rosea]MCB8822865.1 hypothetical protein [Microvirga rosea]